MASQFAPARKRAFSKQNGFCYYCGRSMWQEEPEQFAKKYGISNKEVRALQCTAEHLIARCDGGSNGKNNIVAACLCCNQRRHQRKKLLSLSEYITHVLNRINQGRWFPQRLAV